jgi:perosamine synthetase
MIPIARPIIGDEEINSVVKVLRSGNLTQGLEVEEFEKEFSKLVSGRESIAVNSGTSGLHIALLAMGISKGDEVIVPSFTFAATANAVSLTGATPVFVDIERDTFNIDPNAIIDSISKKTRAIIPVHLYGQPAAMNEIVKIATINELFVIEDSSQAHLAKLSDKPVGTFGDAGVFSFYPTKNMTSGEGGMITTGLSMVSTRCRLLRNQGMERKYENEIVGLNNRMTDIHAAIGRVQLSKLQSWTDMRRSNASFYDANLEGVLIPFVSPNCYHVYHQYTIRIVGHNRDEFAKELERRGVGTGIYYPTPVHKLKSFGSRLNLPETYDACREVLSIPIHPTLSQTELEHIVSSVNAVAKAGT